MPKWVDDRKNYILSKNPGMSESTAWAIATQQSYATNKAPKNYGTTKGRKKSKRKYKKPSSKYEHVARPKKKKSQLIKELITLATHLNNLGFNKLSNTVTELLKITLK